MALWLVTLVFALTQFEVSRGEVASAVWNAREKTYEVEDGLSPDSVAWANFTDEITSTGWSYLNVVTNGSYADKMQAYAAGLVEGYVTDQVIFKHWINTVEGYCNDQTAYCERLTKFLKRNRVWIEKQIVASEGKDPYWHHVCLLFAQLDGLEEGYARRVSQGRAPNLKLMSISSEVLGFIMVQIAGDLEDLEAALNKSVSSRESALGSGSCSALVKIIPGNADIYVSQDTWTTYQSMLRILKNYNFNYHLTAEKDSPVIPGSQMTFSSYPASLTSIDDFYLISSGLASMETTIGNSNPDLWQYVQPESVLEWMRSMLANRLAKGGNEWTKLFITQNSGTYNNQWMVVDFKLFTPKQPLKDNLLWVVEQLPKYYARSDETDVLRNQSYWSSYNIPFFPSIYNLSGFAASAAKKGDFLTYDKAPRALIFKRDNSRVTDLNSMIKLMRYNDYTHDPLSQCNCNPPYSADNAISARNDLNPKNGTYPFRSLGHSSVGGIDMKVTSLQLFTAGISFIAVSGPTYDTVPAFQWSKADFEKDIPHLGHPDLWRFDPVVFGITGATNASMLDMSSFNHKNQLPLQVALLSLGCEFSLSDHMFCCCGSKFFSTSGPCFCFNNFARTFSGVNTNYCLREFSNSPQE